MRLPSNDPRFVIALGFAGSCLTTIGSLGAGWLGPASVINDWPVVAAMRSSVASATASMAAVVVGVLLVIVAWLLLGVVIGVPNTDVESRRSAGPGPLSTVVIAGALWALPLVVSLPLFSRDVFAYVGQGRVLAHNLDPYAHPIASVPGWFGIGVDPLWATTPAPYGPVFAAVERAVVQGAGSPEAAIFLFRAVAVVSLAAIGVYAARLARLRGLNAAHVLWWSVASPLTLMTLVASAHNDALMLALILAGVYHAHARPIPAVVLVSLAIGVKPIALVALPIIGLVWAGRGSGAKATRATGAARADHTSSSPPASASSWLRRVIYWAVSAVIAAIVLCLTSILVGVGFGWVQALALPASIPSWYSPSGMLAFGVGTLLGFVGADTDLVETIIKAVGVGIGAVGVAYAMLTPRKLTPITRMALAFSLFIVFSPTIYPWYVVWVLIMWALVGLQEHLSRWLAACIAVFLCCTSVAEPIDAPALGDAADAVRIGTTVAVFVAATAIMVAFWLAERGEHRWLDASAGSLDYDSYKQ